MKYILRYRHDKNSLNELSRFENLLKILFLDINLTAW